jgi:hypothetical protein
MAENEAMKLTEREMTTAVDAVARRLFAAGRPPWRRGSVDAAWDALPAMQKYHRRATVGEAVLPALLELPERQKVGERPTFTPEEYAAAAETTSRARLEHRSPGAWDGLSPRRRKRQVRATVALTRLAVAALPIRQDPDALIVPDHP